LPATAWVTPFQRLRSSTETRYLAIEVRVSRGLTVWKMRRVVTGMDGAYRMAAAAPRSRKLR
jgi:hypothetical protein